MIKAIVFDCFGVLTSDGWLPFKHAHFVHDSEKYQQATALNALANAQKISYQQFLQDLSRLAGVSVNEVDRAMHTTHKSEVMLELVRSLSADYKIGLLSNISGDWLHELFTQDELELFDATALSYETGYAKPQKQAYHIIAERLGCSQKECVFIDDQRVFVDAAVDVGMRGIVFESVEQLKSELTTLLYKTDSNK